MQLAALQEQGRFRGRGERKRIECRLEEVKTQEIEESLWVETKAVERAKSAAHDQITESLALFERVVAAWGHVQSTKGTDEGKTREREFKELRERVRADELARLKFLAWNAELIREEKQEQAEALSEKAEREVAVLNRTKRRLARRAAAARRRRAAAAGIEPEPEDQEVLPTSRIPNDVKVVH